MDKDTINRDAWLDDEVWLDGRASRDDEIASLRQQIETLTKERDQFREKYHEWKAAASNHTFCPQSSQLALDLDTMTKERDEIAAALREWGQHEDDCRCFRFRCEVCHEAVHSDSRQKQAVKDGKIVWESHPYDHGYAPSACDCGFDALLSRIGA